MHRAGASSRSPRSPLSSGSWSSSSCARRRAEPGLAQLSSQDLTVLVANLNARNDQLRTEASTSDSELATLAAEPGRGDVSVDEITADLRRVRAYAGLDASAGPGVTIRSAARSTAPASRS